MSDPTDTPVDTATHRRLAVDLFNETWRYLDMAERGEQDDLAMLEAALASRHHWRQVGGTKEFAVSDWQVARVLAVLGAASLAQRFGRTSLESSAALAPFYRGYAHEALARAAAVGGDEAARDHHLAEARTAAEQVKDDEERKMLADDLATIA